MLPKAHEIYCANLSPPLPHIHPAVLMVLLSVLSLLAGTGGAPAKFQSIEEWNLWKEDHSKLYLSEKVHRA